jgi:hypothetical protein
MFLVIGREQVPPGFPCRGSAVRVAAAPDSEIRWRSNAPAPIGSIASALVGCGIIRFAPRAPDLPRRRRRSVSKY